MCFFLVLLLLDSHLAFGYPPQWTSDWFTLSANSGAESKVSVPHPLAEVPLKVKVMVRPTTGANAGMVFEGESVNIVLGHELDL